MAPRKPTGIDIRHNADGTISYRLRWRQGGGRDGKQCSHTFSRRSDAVDALRSIELAGWMCYCRKHAPADVEVGQYGAKGKPKPLTWGGYARRRFENLTGVGNGYRAQVIRDLDKHMAPLADLTFEQVTPDAVQEWVRGLEIEGLSPTTIKRLLVQAGSVQRAALESGAAVGQPFARQRVGRVDRDQHTEMVCLTQQEWLRLQSALPEGTYRDLCTVLVGTGMRFGEATALRVRDVDMDADEDHVQRTPGAPPRLHVAQAWKFDGAGGFELGPPKSRRSRRTIKFGQAVADALRPHLAGRKPDELVFTTITGAPVRNSNFAYRVWRPAVLAAGLERRPRIHDLRHTHASWLIAAGRPTSAVSRRLGHESIQTTDSIYTHILPSVDDDDVAALDEAMPVEPPEEDEV